MSDHPPISELQSNADTLAELVETADSHDIPVEVQAAHLRDHVWKRDIPQHRAIQIINQERERLESYGNISLSESSRSPRYMDINDLELVSGYEFEHILATILRRVEGDATVTDATGDQGLDVVWFRETQTVGIQAKAYQKGNPVSNNAVQEIYTGSAVKGAEYEIDTSAVVTTSRYTQGAKEAADNADVILYGRSDLQTWLEIAELDAEAIGNVLENI